MGVFFGVPERLWMQVVRYALAGTAGVGVDFTVHRLLGHALGISGPLADTCGHAVGGTLTYLYAITWIFKTRNVANRWVEVQIFALIIVSGMAINWPLTAVLRKRFGLDEQLAWALVTLIAALWVLVNKKLWLFSDRRGGLPVQQTAPSAPPPAAIAATPAAPSPAVETKPAGAP